jgi:hypothetical protein
MWPARNRTPIHRHPPTRCVHSAWPVPPLPIPSRMDDVENPNTRPTIGQLRERIRDDVRTAGHALFIGSRNPPRATDGSDTQPVSRLSDLGQHLARRHGLTFGDIRHACVAFVECCLRPKNRPCPSPARRRRSWPPADPWPAHAAPAGRLSHPRGRVRCLRPHPRAARSSVSRSRASLPPLGGKRVSTM